MPVVLYDLMSEVTQTLNQIEQGDVAAASDLLPLIDAELHRLATYRMKREAGCQMSQPTALVHEAYLRLVGISRKTPGNGRAVVIFSQPRPKRCVEF